MRMRQEVVGGRVTTYNFPEVATENSSVFMFIVGGYVGVQGPYSRMAWTVSDDFYPVISP